MSGPGRLHHIALGAANVERVAAFYRDVFGLPETARHRHADGSLRSIWLDLDGAALMVEQREGQEPPAGSGWFLVALRVSPEQRARIEAELERRGFAVESRTEFTSYTRDPERNRIAISHYPLPSRAG